ncbi:Ubiquitin-protein ligase [Orbilia oligospora]|uniref:HECT-type E3 ubiquitin transferase n=1 Tax=Orbilia oligospora TaxID=2813651 RepID=A0A7C8PGI3_ORBOL|nr:Ubiquitin-protein ligase [Orbilia oligospora]TGJ65538.1 Ubiquitin-protein ligase [Orbilia oligospora]
MQGRRQTRSTAGRHSADSSQPPTVSSEDAPSTSAASPGQPSSQASPRARRHSKRKSVSISQDIDVIPQPPVEESTPKKRSRTRGLPDQPSPAESSTSTPSKPLTRSARKRSRLSDDFEMDASSKGEVPSTSSPVEPPETPTTRKSTRSKKQATGTPSSAGRSQSSKRQANEKKVEPQVPTTPTPTTRKSKRKENNESKTAVAAAEVKTADTKDDKDDHLEEDEDEDMGDELPPADPPAEEEEEEGRNNEDYDREIDEDDMYEGFSHRSLSQSMRALSGMLSGIPSRLRDILSNLKNKEDITVQMLALQELSEILLMANEDSLSGNIPTDQFVKELVSIMSEPDMFGVENPELMLLACRCLANLMEALPSATSNVVYGGAVPVLCQKLLEIQYIDLAEQALSTLEKISHEYPTSIIREGGLVACLNFLDFFSTNVQRTAVTTAANCCRNIPEDSFPTVRDVMPILLGVLNSSDQKVVEQGCLCISRIVESFKHLPEKLEELVSQDILRAILQLLLPGTTNLVGAHIHTQFLRVLSILARTSPGLSVAMFNMNVTETLYQIMTGVSPPAATIDFALKVDRVMTMQALIHRPKEQVTETLNVVSELLPRLPQDEIFNVPGVPEYQNQRTTSDDPQINEKRIDLLKSCQEELRCFAIVLLPTLTDTYLSTVNLQVRQKVLSCQLKMIVNLEVELLKDALSNVQYASFLASILSQKDHPSVVAGALQISELLLRRLPGVYRYHFHREGVVSEIRKLAEQIFEVPEDSDEEDEEEDEDAMRDDKGSSEPAPEQTMKDVDTSTDNSNKSEDDDDDNENEEHREDEDSSEASESPSLHRPAAPPALTIEQWIIVRARSFIEEHDKDIDSDAKKEAEKVLKTIRDLVGALEGSNKPKEVLKELAGYFQNTNSLTSISSFELSHSMLVEGLLKMLTGEPAGRKSVLRREFLEVFMGQTDPKDGNSPFSVLVAKLQELLSRSEHFEVNTVHHNAYDGNRSPASMLAKQLRLKLVADENSDIPKAYRSIMVSIHAIATFKALDDYLRPRIALSEQPRISRAERGGHLANALAAFAAAAAAGSAAGPSNPDGPSSSTRTKKSSRSTRTKKSEEIPQADSPEETPKTPTKKDKISKAAREALAAEEQLECMDERQMSEQEDMDDMNALLEDLDEEMADSPGSEPGAVNMELAGGKVTARKEDGTKIATPVGTPSRDRGSGTPVGGLPSHPALSNSRPISYAAAAGTPTDWHIEFSIGDRVLSNDTTIYGAVHQSNRPDEGESHRSVWSSTYTIKFRRASGSAPAESSLSPVAESSQAASGAPLSVEKNKTTASILHLLSILHSLNSNIDDVFSGEHESSRPRHPPALSQFVNTKLTAKLNRQLEEPLIVASSCLPSWSEDLARYYPFLFPFETRFLFLQSTSFGYSRSMNRWQSATANEGGRDRRDDNRPFLGRLQRQKVRISRNRIFDSAVKVMELYGASPSVLEVEYFEEVGTGLGPTLEFYSSVSREFARKTQNMWREGDSFADTDKEYAFGAQGLFPAPMDAKYAETEAGKRILQRFKILGKFVARAMLDSRLIDISFNANFFRGGDDAEAVAPSYGAVKTVDKGLAQSLNLLRKFAVAKSVVDEMKGLPAAERNIYLSEIRVEGVTVDDLALDFTLPGYPHIELVKGGADKQVTINNVGDYVDKVIDLTLGSGVRRQVDAFRSGFSQVFPYAALKAFTPDELVMMFGRVDEDWSLETLMDSIKADHGFNMDSKSVRNLLQVMSAFTLQQRREFLQFVTGSPKLPIGGFKNLTPMFTVVCKPSESPLVSDDYLPSVMTCVNYLKLPDYTCIEVLRQRLHTAVHEGSGAFHLS